MNRLKMRKPAEILRHINKICLTFVTFSYMLLNYYIKTTNYRLVDTSAGLTKK